MKRRFYIAAALFAGSLAIPGAAEAQRQSAPPTAESALPLCRDADAGERCRTMNGMVRVRPAQDDQARERARQARRPLGGGDPGWEVRGEQAGQPGDEFGGEDPGWVRQPRPGDGGVSREQTSQPGDGFGGDDPGWVRQPDNRTPGPAVAGGGTMPEPEAMECEFCDDDEDVPQGPIDNTPRPDTTAPQAPAGEDDDCEWHNPAGGPDQEFCDE